MAFTYLNDATVALGGLDLTTQSNKVGINVSHAELENTTFRNGGARSYQAGLPDTDISVDGYFYAGTDGATPSYTYPDPVLFSELTTSTTGTPITIAANEPIGSVAYVTRCKEFNYSLLGSVGELAPFSISAKGNQKVARGITLTDPDTLNTGNFTSASLTSYSTIATGKTMFANVHLLALSSDSASPTVQVTVQSDLDATPSGAANRIVFPSLNAVGSQHLSLAGPVTHPYWGVQITVTGTNTKYRLLVAIGIV